MTGQEQPYGEWLAETERRWLDDGRMTVVNISRFFRELRQRDEELERLRARVEECKRSHWVRVEGTLGQTVRYEGV